MALVHSPRIVTDGIALSLDAGNSKSWNVGISSDWTDRVGGNNGTLVNGTFHNDGPFAGAGYVEFDGTGQAVSVPAGSDFAYGTGDFTIEGWFYTTVIGTVSGAGAAGHIFFGQTVSGTNYLLFGIDSNGKLLYYSTSSGGGSDRFSSAPDGSVVLNQWQHIALCRSSGTTKAFVDGQEIISISDTFDFTNTDRNPTIGNYTHSLTTQPFNGYVSNFRILKGTALYTSDFTVPTHELEVIGDTVLLCCNNSDSAGAEATGKTATVSGSAPASTFSPGLTRDFTFGTEFRGVTTFDTQGYFVPPSGTTEQRGRGRGIVGGGESPSRTDAINFIQIQSTGNAQDFGDLTSARNQLGACASSTRGIFGGGYLAPPSTYLNVMEFVTIASTGDALDFGDLSVDRQGPGSCSNSTRGVFAGGSDPGNLNTIDFVTIASTGDATDFGDLITKRDKHRGCGSSIRAIIFSPEPGEDIQFFNYASTGRATSFGEITPGTKGVSGAASDSTRALRFGGGTHPEGDVSNNISYITISSTGNEQEFGDLSAAGSSRGTAMSNSIRAVQIVNNANGQTNVMEYVTIQSTGNGKNFGDLNTTHLGNAGSTSDSHGGLG